MKYIKEYKLYNLSENHSSDVYTYDIIDRDNFDRAFDYSMEGKLESITDRELDIMESYFRSRRISYFMDKDSSLINGMVCFRIYEVLPENERNCITLYKMPDDWYYVYLIQIYPLNLEYYKCDEVFGVIELFKDKLGYMVESIGTRSGLDVSYRKTRDNMKKISNSDYYQRLFSMSDASDNQSQLDEILSTGVSMDDISYNILLDKLKDYGYYNLNITDSQNYLSCRNYWGVVHIYSCADEWFLVLCIDAWYKCDQLSGVIRLLDDVQACIAYE